MSINDNPLQALELHMHNNGKSQFILTLKLPMSPKKSVGELEMRGGGEGV